MIKKLSKIIFIVSILLLSLNISLKIYDEENNDKTLEEYYENKIALEEKIIDKENDYIGVLNIASIDLHQGFYDQLSTKNKLKNGIKNIKDDMDNVLVLASHSGKSMIAKFNNLKKLKMGDEIILSYNNCDYKYEFNNSYKVDKTGHVYVKYDIKKKALILITCDLSDNSKQIVYVSYMI